MTKGKTLVAFYSLHGHAKIIGEKIARILEADVEEIIDKKDRSMLSTWFISASNEELRTPTRIQKPQKDPSQYDLVIVGTPIWDGITPAVRKYLQTNKGKFKKVGFFSTFGASPENAFYVMSEIINRKPVATLEVQDRQVSLSEGKERIEKFCREIKRAL